MFKAQETIFYNLDKTIKSYRKFAQSRIKQAGLNITIDQLIVLNELNNNQNISQVELADLIFKDVGSITRMMDLLVKKKLIKRKQHPENRKRNKIDITKSGYAILNSTQPIISNYREEALTKISKKEIEDCRKTLEKIFKNIKTSKE